MLRKKVHFFAKLLAKKTCRFKKSSIFAISIIKKDNLKKLHRQYSRKELPTKKKIQHVFQTKLNYSRKIQFFHSLFYPSAHA